MATSPGTTGASTRAAHLDRGPETGARPTSRASTETKHSSKTSELYAYIVATFGVLIAGLVTKAGDGHDDRLQADDAWLIVGILTVGYMLSRGLAKSGSREPFVARSANDDR
jgi:hypothetical protein